MLDFKVLDARATEERAEWCRIWESWHEREVFAHPDYVRLFARREDRVLCASLRGEQCGILYPFVLRPLAQEPWTDPDDPTWDLIGPYGYGGIFAWDIPDEVQAQFNIWYADWIESERVVSSFIRLSLFPGQMLPSPGQVEISAPNVVRTLDLTLDELWYDYEHKVRKNVNRAKRSELTVEVDSAGNRLEDFLAIYHATMERRGASDAYYFPREFFEAILRDLLGQYAFFHVLRGQEVVSTELVLVSGRYVYSFLGGTVADAFALRPNDLLKHEIALWARQEGKRAFVLGGGYDGEDGIFRYKRAFAPKGTTDFCVSRQIHDATTYDRLVKRRLAWAEAQGGKWQPVAGYFPKYRACGMGELTRTSTQCTLPAQATEQLGAA